jgi:DNA-directed RNA polymerase subunit RPC12/RpoP
VLGWRPRRRSLAARRRRMPIDQGFEDDDDNKDASSEGADRRFGDFDCPECNANNPYDDKFGQGDEIRCFYCGGEFLVKVTDSGRLKLRLL